MPLAKRRILCVEDHEDTRFMLTHLLESQGYFVITAEDATMGLALWDTQPFDLLILDIWLPDGDGNTLCSKVREFAAETPIIVYSGAARESDIQNALSAGANAFVSKPNISQLIDRVNYYLNGARTVS